MRSSTRCAEVGRPVRTADTRDSGNEHFPVVAGARRSRRIGKRCDRIGGVGHEIEHPLRRGRTDAGDQMHQPETSDAIAWILDETQQRQHVLDMGGIEEFETAEFDEGDVAAG